jgi:CHAD domain-containing protein
MAASIQRHHLLRKRLQRFTRLLHRLEKGDVVAVHRTRVASRRLRELLPILEVEPATARKLARRLRKVTERLGTVRELDVLLLLLDELAESDRADSRTLARVATEIARERAETRERILTRKLPIAELERITRRLDLVAETLERADEDAAGRRQRTRGWRWALDARIAHRAAALQTAIHDAGAVYLPERLHIVRIALKKLRYAMELSAEVAGLKRTPDLQTLKRAQDVLGRLHDFQVLIARVRQMQASLAPPDVGLWRDLDGLIASLENSCRRLHARYMRERSEIEPICERVGQRPPSAAARRAAG